MKWKIIVVTIIFLGLMEVVSSSPVGYEYLDNGKVLKIWNGYDQYFLNVSSGIQMSNYYNEYWTHNLFCVGYKTEQWNYKCLDTLPIKLTPETDNLTYVNVSGTKNTLILGRWIKLTLNYHLKLNDKELGIETKIKNVGILNINNKIGFAWKTINIKINNDEENDIIKINSSTYYLNESLNLLFRNMTAIKGKYWWYDSNGTFHFDYESHEGNRSGTRVIPLPFYDLKDKSVVGLRWKENINYLVQIKSQENQSNSPLIVALITNGLEIQQEKTAKFWWHDPTEVELVSQSEDDCDETIIGSVECGDNEMTISSLMWGSGIMFKNIDVPQGTQITSANLTLSVFPINCAGTPGCYQTIYGVNTSDALTWSSDHKPSIQNKTANSTIWQETIYVAPNGIPSRKIDVTKIVQEILDIPEWVSGNNMSFVIKADSYGRGDNLGVKTYDYGTPNIPKITIIFSTEDSEPPQVFLIDPDNNNETINSYSNLTCNVSDNIGVSNVSFLSNWSGVWIYQDTDTSGVQGNYTFLLNLTDFRYTYGFDFGQEILSKGITSNETDYWWIGNNFLHHYNSSFENQTDGFDLSSAGVGSPVDVTTNGSDFWVVDSSDKFIYHFDAGGNNMSDGFSVKDFGNGLPISITTNGSDFWVVDISDKFIYHYDYSGVNLTGGFFLNYCDTPAPRGIATNGSDFWVLDTDLRYVIQVDSQGNNITKGFSVSDETISPRGLTTRVRSGGIVDNIILEDVNDYEIDFYEKLVSQKTFDWTCRACDTSNNCAWASSNYTITFLKTTCWTYNSINKFLSIPIGCLFNRDIGEMFSVTILPLIEKSLGEWFKIEI